MARKRDAEKRKEELTEVLLSIASERGLEGVSIREVASEAGVAIGTVQYYFKTKDEMLLFVFERLVERFLGRMEAIDQSGTLRQVLRRALLELLPLDEQRRMEVKVYMAFSTRATVDSALGKVQAEMLAEYRGNCSRLLGAAQELGEISPSINIDTEGAIMAAFVDGLSVHALTDPKEMSPETAVSTLDAYLGRVFYV